MLGVIPTDHRRSADLVVWAERWVGADYVGVELLSLMD